MLQKIIIAIIVSVVSLFSGTSGKIAGYAVNAENDSPLAGLNVIITETGQGASTDEDGYFFINNVHPGTYSVKASYIGFTTLNVRNVIVTVDHTTELNLQMSPSVLEMGESVVVTAERPLILIDETSKRAVIGGEQLTDQLPLANMTEVLALQSGVVRDASGDVHIRGGRSGEVAYLIDGVYVRNPFNNSMGGNVAIDAIQEMEVISGTFNAEYGSAMSGVVNMVTKEGSPEWKFRLQYESAMLNESPYQQADWLLNTDEVSGLSDVEKEDFRDVVLDSSGLSAYRKFNVTKHHLTKDLALIPVLGTLNGSISGPIPFTGERGSFFIAGSFKNENSYLPFGFDLERVVSSKLSYKVTPTFKVQFSSDWTKEYEQGYSHSYKYWPYYEQLEPQVGSYPISEELKTRNTLRISHSLNNTSYYNLSFSRITNYDDNIVPERNVVSDAETGELISSDYIMRDYFEGLSSNFRLGDVRYWYKTETVTHDLDWDLASQVNRFNFVKTGIEYREHDIFRHRIGMAPRERLQYFTHKPIEFAAYIQDKIELEFLVVNVGIRFDYFDPKDNYFSNEGTIIEAVTDAEGQTRLVTVSEDAAEPKSSFSPRIGFAHPISATTMFHFSYGQFFQVPRFYDLYRDNDIRAISQNDPLIGNPGLEPEETTSFEVGIKQQLGEDYALDVTAYYKDIDNLISSMYYFGARDYTIFVNADYGRVQGLDFTLTKRAGNYYSAALNYSFIIANGNESDPYEGYSNYREDDAYLRPNRTFPLDYDQRHSISGNVNLSLPKGFGPAMLSMKPFQNISANVLMRVNSGLPYTPSSRNPDATIVPEPNSARKPWTNQVDMRLSKRLIILQKNCDLYLRVENIFDQINVRYVWTRTGQAWNQGPTSNYSKDRQANPENVGRRRTIKAGLVIRL